MSAVECSGCHSIFYWDGVGDELPEECVVVESKYYCDDCEKSVLIKVPMVTSAYEN